MALVLGDGASRKGRQRRKGAGETRALDLQTRPSKTVRESERREDAWAPGWRKFSAESAPAAALPPACPVPFPGGNRCGVEGRGGGGRPRRRRPWRRRGWEEGVRPARSPRSLRALVAGQPRVSPKPSPAQTHPPALPRFSLSRLHALPRPRGRPLNERRGQNSSESGLIASASPTFTAERDRLSAFGGFHS